MYYRCIQCQDSKKSRQQTHNESPAAWERSRSRDTYQLHELLEERNELQELVVISVHKPALDRNSIGKLRETQNPDRVSISHRIIVPPVVFTVTKEVYLIGKGLGRVVDYYRLGKIPSENVEVFNVISLNTHTVLTK